MKSIKLFFVSLAILLSWYTYTSQASYTPSFANTKLINTYDTRGENLKLTFLVSNVNNIPSKDYYVKIFINWQSYTSDLDYNSASSQLYSFVSVNINKEDLKSYYYVNYYIMENDSNYHVYSKTNYKLLVLNQESQKWSSVSVTNKYDSSYQKLKITFSLDWVTKEPSEDYYMKLKFNNTTYSSNFIYDSAGDKLYAFFSIDINKNNLKSYYYINYSVLNDSTNAVIYSKSNYNLNVKNQDNFSWSNMKVSNSYNQDKEDLQIDFKLNNVVTKPSTNYYVKLKFSTTSNTTYSSDLNYSPSDNMLSTSFLIDIARTRLSSYYYISYYVYNDDNILVYTSTNYKISVSWYTYYNNNYYNNYNNNNTYYNWYYYNWYYYCNWVYYSYDYCNNWYYNNNTYNIYDNINWSNTSFTNNYDSYNNNLRLEFYTTSIYSNPINDYYVKVYFNWNYYTSYFTYESWNSRLHASLDINDNSLSSNTYSLTYYIMDSNDNSKYTKSSNVYISRNYYYNNNYYNNNDNNYNSDYYNYAWDRINSIENNYYNRDDRVYYINREIDSLNNNYNNYNYDFRNKANQIFRDRINYLKNNY